MKLVGLALCAAILFASSVAIAGQKNGGYAAPPPPPAPRVSAPTYAPGGHAITPTPPQPAPAANASLRPAGVQQQYNPPGPTYAPGGQAVIPTVPQPAFSPTYQSALTQSRPVAASAAVGTVPQPSAGRLNLTPVSSSPGPTSSVVQMGAPLAQTTNTQTTNRVVLTPSTTTGLSNSGSVYTRAPAVTPITSGNLTTPSGAVVNVATGQLVSPPPNNGNINSTASNNSSAPFSISPPTIPRPANIAPNNSPSAIPLPRPAPQPTASSNLAGNTSSASLGSSAYYIQPGTGARLTQEQIKNGSFPAGTSFIESGTGKQVTAQHITSLNSSGTARVPLSALPQTGLYPRDIASPYTFKVTSDNRVQVSKDGKPLLITTKESAQQQYGFIDTQTGSVPSPPTVPSKSVAAGSALSVTHSGSVTSTTSNDLNKLNLTNLPVPVVVLGASASPKPAQGTQPGATLGTMTIAVRGHDPITLSSYSNGTNQGTSYGPPQYQCVALIKNYANQLGLTTAASGTYQTGTQTAQTLSNLSGGKFTYYSEATAAVPPTQGAVISLNTGDSFGHVGVAQSVVPSGTNQYKVTLFDQNWPYSTGQAWKTVTFNKEGNMWVGTMPDSNAPNKTATVVGWANPTF